MQTLTSGAEWGSTKKISLEDYITQLDADSEKLHFRAEEEQNWTLLVTESNSLKKIANEKIKVVFDLVYVAQKWEDKIKTVK